MRHWGATGDLERQRSYSRIFPRKLESRMQPTEGESFRAWIPGGHAGLDGKDGAGAAPRLALLPLWRLALST